jgi:hypothetical protein
MYFVLNGHTALVQSTAQKQSAASMTFRAISTMQETNITPRRISTETRNPPWNSTLKRLACSATYELSFMSPVNCVAVELQFPRVAWLLAISRVKLRLVTCLGSFSCLAVSTFLGVCALRILEMS